MSKNTKIILIIAGAVGTLVVGGILALVFLISRMVDNTGFEESKAEGAEFGKAIDNAACQEEGLARAARLGIFEITENVKNEYFTEGCLETSRPTRNFCRNLPTEIQDIWNDHDWKDAECEKLGLKNKNLQCRSVLKARLDFCEEHR